MTRVYTERTACRLCGGTELADVLDLQTQHLQGQFPAATDPHPPSAPLAVCRCASPLCGMVQLRYTVDPADQFTNYFYNSGVSATMRAHLKAVAEEACAMLLGRKAEPVYGARILDIGGNNGELLNAIPIGTGNRVLVDPSDVAVEHPGIKHVRGFFPNDVLLTQQYDLVFSVACFYSVNDPVGFAKAVKKVLAADGLWCVEVASLPDILRNVDLGYFCHEHACTHSVFTLTEIAKRARLKVVRVEESASNGGSVRCYLTHEFSTAYPFEGDRSERIGALWSEGRALAQDGEACAAFGKAGREVIAQLRAHVRAEVAAGGRVHALAASTKSGVLLQAAGLSHPLIIAASDRDPRKVGRRMPGTGIPIWSESESRAAKPTLYVCLLPASFHGEILDRERAAGTTADFLFVMPEVKRVGLGGQVARAA